MALILVVDDDNQIRRMLRRILEKEGYEVVEAIDGDEAMRIYQERPVDLVITDLIMPKKEGIETIIELRRIFPEVKIIAISGGGRVGPAIYLTMAEKLGASRIFTKPFEKDELLAAVKELVPAQPELLISRSHPPG